MIPILYAENETNFNHNGLGALYGTIECLVTEERNGAFELELVYPVDGVLAREITEFRFIMAKPNDVDDPHLFRIYEIGKNLEAGNITVYAASKTNDLGANLLEHVVVENVTAGGAMNAIRDNLIEPTNYMFISDIETLNSGEWGNQNPLSAIAGEEGSILSKWGGEIKRTNDAIYLYGRRGTDKVSVIRPGKNILGFNMVVSTKGMTTGLIPIATYTTKDTNVSYTIRGTQINSPLISNYPVHYLAMKDYSSYDIWPEEQKDEEGNPIPMSDAEFRAAALVNLNNAAASYFSVQNPGSDKPKITSTIDLLLLSDSDEYAKYKNLEHISLTDTVEVYVEQFDVDVEIKVHKLVYDSLKEQVRKIEAGSARYTLYSDVQKTYQDQVDKVKEYISTVENGIYNTIALTADEKNRIFRGYTTPDPSLVKEEDLWFKPVANGEVEMYRYTNGSWVLAITNADKIVIGTLDAGAVNVININADNIATGSITGPNGEWNLNTGALYLGSSYADAAFKWDGTDLTIKMESVVGPDGRTIDEIIDDGFDSAPIYTWIKYADDANGSGMSDSSTGKTYLGLASGKTTQVESSDPLDYTWTLIKGPAGLPGQGLTSVSEQYYRSTSATTQTGGSWLDTAPAYLDNTYVWTRLKYIWENPTATTYSTPTLSAIWGKIHEHEASIKINADNILSRVLQSTYDAKMGVFSGTVSEIKQTAESVKMEFNEFQIGGENLIRRSHILSDKFESYQDSVYTTLRDDISVPAWGADNATQVRTSSAGTSDLKARWVISDDITFMTGKEMSFSVWAKNNRTDQSVTIGTNRIGEPITLSPLESRKLEYIGVLPENETKMLILEVRGPSSGYYVDVTLWHPKWELGNKITEWSQHPDELYTGVTKIDKEGVNVSRSDSEVNTQIAYDGLRVLDGDVITASMVEGIASIPELYSDRVHGDVINTHPGGTIDIGTGRDFTSINEALAAIGNRKHLLRDLTFNVYSRIIENITIRGFSGGMINIRLQENGAIHGNIIFYQNSAGGYISGIDERRLVKGSIRFTGGNGYIQNLIVSPNSLTTTGIVSEYGSQVFVSDCDIVNARSAILAQHAGTIMALNNIGEITSGQAVYNTYNGGVLHARGTMPLGTPKFGGTSTAFQYDAGTTQVPSQYAPPTAMPTLMSQTFSPTKLETYSYRYNAISSYYPNRAAQNRWDTGTGMFEGRITFGEEVHDYINDRDGDTGLKVELQVRRYSGTNGAWGGVAPDRQFTITGGSFGLVNKGEWSDWVTISPTLITATGFTFKFGSQSTGDKYAVWDRARIRVTKTKNI